MSPREVTKSPPGTLMKLRGTVSSNPLTINFHVEVAAPELRFVVAKMPLPEPTNTRSELKGSISSAPAQWTALFTIQGKPLAFMAILLFAKRSFQFVPPFVLTKMRSPHPQGCCSHSE